MDKVQQSLNALREQIDSVDSDLVELLTKRSNLTRQVGQIKSEAGLPIYVPSRETELINKRRAQASELGINPELIDDILRRLMRESYQSQNAVGYNKVRQDDRSIVVVGGDGKLGSLFCRLFTASGYVVHVLHEGNWSEARSLVEDAALVLVSVPIHATLSVIAQLPPLPDDCVLADLTSIKSEPLNAMLEVHSGPVVGLHPMFGPDIPSLVRQVIIVCEGRHKEQYQWLLAQLKIWSLNLFDSTSPSHDHAMALIQVMKHFSSFVYGKHLMEEGADIDQLLAMSSPIYRLELAMVGRLFAQNPTLYADIIFSDPANISMVERYANRLLDMIDMLKNNDKKQFIAHFEEISQWFGEYSEHFLLESRGLLSKAQDLPTKQVSEGEM